MASNVEAYIAINGSPASNVKLIVPYVGPWIADVDLHDAPSDVVPRAKVSLKIGAASLVGTVREVGEFADSKRVRVVAGGDGWSQMIEPKGYHNDALVKASTVLADAARACGETIGTTSSKRLGTHYTREHGPAAACITDVTSNQWWVGFDGITNVGPRPSTVATKDVTVLDYDGRHRRATIDVAEVTMITPGMRIKSRMPSEQAVRSIEFEITPNGLKCWAWCGANGESSPFGDALRAAIEKIVGEYNLGIYRYRVLSIAGDGRLNLQAVDNGQPDINNVPIWPGNYGMHSKPDTQTECLVSFANGDRGMPIVIAFSPGNAGASAVARQGDAVDVLLPPSVVSGTMIMGGTPTPFTGVATWPTAKTVGIITGGSGKAKQE